MTELFLMLAFTLPLNWQPADDSHEGFVVEEKPEHGGWRDVVKLGRNERRYVVVEERPGLWCYRLKATNQDGESPPTQRYCGRNKENELAKTN